MTQDDIEVVRTLAREIWWAYYPAIIPPAQIEHMLAAMYGHDVIRREIAQGVAWELAIGHSADESLEPVGYLSFEHDAAAKSLKLHKLYLVERLHGKGLGAAMIARVLEAASGLGARTVWLQVNKRNARAIRAYERAGFTVTDEIVIDIGGGFVMDDYVMTSSP